MPKRIPMAGKRFGRLTVLCEQGKAKGAIITGCATSTFFGDDESHMYNVQTKPADKAALDALIARVVPTAGQPNLGTEDHER
jgi:hypothetical protein